jgi:hypothetical protein
MILRLLREGMTYVEVAETLRITPASIRWRKSNHPAFAAALEEAREVGREVRDYNLWYHHYRRGKRPPTGKGHGGVPRFSVKRRR